MAGMAGHSTDVTNSERVATVRIAQRHPGSRNARHRSLHPPEAPAAAEHCTKNSNQCSCHANDPPRSRPSPISILGKDFAKSIQVVRAHEGGSCAASLSEENVSPLIAQPLSSNNKDWTPALGSEQSVAHLSLMERFGRVRAAF